jgi:thioesterase domain-containing protein/acyl carrier protein
VLHPGAAVEIRALSFEEAMVFDPAAPRLVRTELRRQGERYDFVVRSRGQGDEDWQDHARAGVCVFTGSLPPAPALPAGAWHQGEIPQAQAVAFGPRWNNIARMRLDGRRAVAELELAEPFLGDLAGYASHPAITDMAATFGLHLVDATERAHNLFVPMSIQRVRLVAPLPRRSISRVELAGPTGNRFAAFDVSLHAPDGSPIATFEGFALRGIQPEAVSHKARPHREHGLTDAMLACGIRAEDSHALFTHLFSGARRDLIVSSIDVAQLQRAMRDALPRPVARKAHNSADAANPALNPVEQAIAETWRELLGVDEIAKQDDFFALGGHSLAAIRLFARIRKQFDVDLPLATLFETPTLAALAALVAQRAGVDTTATAVADPKKSSSNVIPLGTRAWSPLVAICRGHAGRTPLFCVHGAGGNVLNFKVISDRLGAEQPFYGLQAQGVDGRLPPLTSVEAMAAQYVDAIRSVHPHGPYQLAGYSAGGVIALEMAQRLKQDGSDVTLLAMIDTLSPTAARRKVSRWTKLWMMRHWSLRFAMEWPSRRRHGKLVDVQYGVALEKLARGEPLPPELVEFHLFRNFVAAQERYQPEPYEGDIVLFKASEADNQYLGAGHTLGWEEHIRGDIRVTGIRGSHFSMMAEPGISELVAALRRELGLADEEPGSGTPPRADPLPASSRKAPMPLGTWFSSVLRRS